MKREIDILTTDECHALLSACSKAPTGIRNQALIVVLWRTCLRIKEALDLLPKDVSERSIPFIRSTSSLFILNGLLLG